MGIQLEIGRIVVVADCAEWEPEDYHEKNRALDRTERWQAEALVHALREFSDDVLLYQSPAELMEHITEHRDDVVFPNWSGERSRNRTALVPAICEAYGIRYVGGDAFAKIVCADKFIAKSLCGLADLPVPQAVLLTDPRVAQRISLPPPPLVVKPIWEGSSVGITQRNLVHSHAQARALALELLAEFGQPVIAEEFAAGREISVCLIGAGTSVDRLAATEWSVNGDPNYLRERLFSCELKPTVSVEHDLRVVTDDLPPVVLDRCRHLFGLLERADMLRVDGRWDGETFKIIELTCDINISPEGEFTGGFQKQGARYAEVIGWVLGAALRRYAASR